MKNLKPLLINRTLKFSGNLIKVFSYAFHYLFPKKRFTIPKQSNAFKKPSIETKIPKIIWQTNFTNKVTLPVYMNYLCNRWMNSDFEYRFMDHEDRDKLISESAPTQIAEAFFRLKDGAAQADLWRLFVLNLFGGCYMDIDAHSIGSISKMVKDEEYCFLLNNAHYTNYFIASTPNNKYLEKAIAIIIDNIEHNRTDKGIYVLTGPITLNTAIGSDNVNHRYHKYTCIQGSFTNEHFQYLDKPKGKWIHTKVEDILR